MAKLWTLLGNIGTVATIETRIREAISDTKGNIDRQALRRLDANIRITLINNLADQDMGDKLDEYIAGHIDEFKGLDTFFTKQDRNEFIEDFLGNHGAWHVYKSEISEVINHYFDELEKNLASRMTDAEKLMYKTGLRIEDEIHQMQEQLANIQSNMDKTKDEMAPREILHTSNEIYAKSFDEVLFLHKHKEDTKVKLQNLFVLPKFDIIERNEVRSPSSDLADYLAKFINLRNDKRENFLFIEGDAGCGKSSLVAFLNAHYKKQDEIGKHIFGNKRLVTVRLRDIEVGTIKETGKFVDGILNYLRAESVEEFEKQCEDAVLLLDGFDELCMIEEMNARAERYIYDLRAFENCKIIITTRPKYIKIQQLDLRNLHIALKHFDEEQIDRWLFNYTNVCMESVDEEKLNYLNRITEEDALGICDTPMALYMIVAGKIEPQALGNEWALYHQIFYKELSETEYNEMFPNKNRKYVHDIWEYREKIYQINEEIAYKMYCTENSKLYLSHEELNQIIESLGIQRAETKELIERCYALCGYWKIDSNKGMVEFYHNNMRDFFLCEKIMREMNGMYEKWKVNPQAGIEESIEKLCTLFQYQELETMVCKFILLRTLYKNEFGEPDDCYRIEIQHPKLPAIFQYLLTSGRLYCFDNDRNPVQNVLSVLSSVVQIYRHLYEPYLEEGRLIKWWDNVSVVNNSGMLRHLFKDIFVKVPVTLQYDSSITLASKANFTAVDLHSCDLRNAGFNYSDLSYTNMEDTILCGCDFTDANLQRAVFTNADIHYAKMTNADLRGCDFGGADLRATELPDGFAAKDQEEQEEHLKELAIRLSSMS